MNVKSIDQKYLAAACCNNPRAMDFLTRWHNYVHDIDDIEDGDLLHAEERIGTKAQAVELYTHPFFLQYGLQLKLLILAITSDYTDSVIWEKAPEKWKREEADVLRHAGSTMVRAVAYLCAEEVAPGNGYTHMRRTSLRLREICYLAHHTDDGKQV